jgi:DNA mismatch endonuclease, patch repair protein
VPPLPLIDQDGGVTLPVPSDPGVSDRMARQRRTGTSPELALRRELHRRGCRFRVHYAFALPGLTRRRCDVAFTRRRVAVFIDGCFWHACPLHATAPKSNAAWWVEKLAKNVARDLDTTARLKAEGWAVIRIWEHEDPQVAAERVEVIVRERT